MSGGLGSSLPVLSIPTGSTLAPPPVPQEAEASDDLGVTYRLIGVHAHNAVATEGLGTNDALALIRGIILTERLRLHPSVLINQVAHLTANDELEIIQRLLPASAAIAADTLGIAPSAVALAAAHVIEGLGLTQVIAPAAVYHLSYSDTVSLAETIVSFFGASVSDTLGTAETLVGNKLVSQALAETVGLAPTLSPQLVLRVTAREGLGLEDTELLQGIYTGNISDEMEIAAAYLSPGGGFTTWAMNTRTAAVTEYDNYQFNSFALMGNKYIGASDGGLYELDGDTDDGASIVAHLKSGFAQWAGARFTLFKGIYLGVRGEGDFVLRLVTGDGNTYNYSVATRDMRSTKVHLGKGLRARYFAFELISTGQDFDLESIEFVPLVAERRV